MTITTLKAAALLAQKRGDTEAKVDLEELLAVLAECEGRAEVASDKLQGERELLPCPFCGGQAETDSRRAYRNIATGKMGDGVAVYCLKCSVESMFCCEDMPEYSRDELLGILVENWNRRAALASAKQEDNA